MIQMFRQYLLFLFPVTILGNLLIILVIISDPHLHTPMYIFLSQFSFTDICISTCTIPKILLNIQTQTRSIMYAGCLAQTFFVFVFTGLENFLLTVMAYDRYMAICHHLRYTVIMNPSLCALLPGLSLLLSFAASLLHILMVLRLSFCPETCIPHFFCELAQLLTVACSDTFINNLLIYLIAAAVGAISISGIIFSYSQIVSLVLKIPSTQGKQKAFSTCGSHLSIVSLFYGQFGVNISSTIAESSMIQQGSNMGWQPARKSAIPSLMYIVVPQLMNPFIYSLRNKDMKGALRRLVSGKYSFLRRYHLPWS